MRQIRCPSCHSPGEWNEKNPHRPFCSERCKNKDFVDWANEDRRIAGSAEYDDLLSEAPLAGQQTDNPLH